MANAHIIRNAICVAGLVASNAVSMASAAAPSESSSIAPETTTASYGDWLVVCATTAAGRHCEAITTARDEKGQPVAALSFGYPSASEPLRLSMRVGINAWVAEPAVVTAGAESHTLPFRVCIPQGCIADKPMSDTAAMSRLRLLSAETPATLRWQDAAGQSRSVKISVKGLNAALGQLTTVK